MTLPLRSGLPHVPLWGRLALSSHDCSCFFKAISWAARHVCPQEKQRDVLLSRAQVDGGCFFPSGPSCAATALHPTH